MTALCVVLPLGPATNTTHRRGQRVPGTYRYVRTPGGARPVLSTAARQWRDGAALLVQSAVRQQGWTDPGGDLELMLTVHGTNRDADSGEKLAVDAVAAGLGVDDGRFRCVVLGRERAGAPCLVATVRPWQAQEAGAA
jgi:hypothetical protein